jgi:hypothetical protein
MCEVAAIGAVYVLAVVLTAGGLAIYREITLRRRRSQ